MEAEKLEEFIKRVPLFTGLTRDEVAKILHKGLTMRVPKGEVVFYQGTVGSQMYVVLGGVLGVYSGEKCVAQLRTGDLVGEMALVTSEPRSATVVAMEDSKLFVLGEDTFKKLMTKNVSIQILLNMIRTMAHRLIDANKRLTS